MDYAREQQDELDALSAIYDDVVSELFVGGFFLCAFFFLPLSPQTFGSRSPVSDGEPKKVTLPVRASDELGCLLTVTYVPKYPEEVPLLALTDVVGLSADELAALLERLNTLVRFISSGRA